MKTALFIRDSYPQLVEEAARGQGEHLATAMALFDCSSQQKTAAIMETRVGLAGVIAQENYSAKSDLDKAAEMYGVMQGAAQAHCQA